MEEECVCVFVYLCVRVFVCECVCLSLNERESESGRERERWKEDLKNGTILFKNSKHVSMHSDPEILMYNERHACLYSRIEIKNTADVKSYFITH